MGRRNGNDELLTPDEFEKQYKVAKSTQASMRSRRQIPFLLLGPRTPRYRRSEIVAWIAGRHIPAAGKARRR
jgi:hypothetical protein